MAGNPIGPKLQAGIVDRGTISLPQGASRTLVSLRQNLSYQDWVCTLFHGYLLLRALAAPDSSGAEFSRRFAFTLLSVSVVTIVLVRGEVLQKGRLRAAVYRLGLFLPVLLSYFEMRTLLPSLEAVMMDGPLLAIDELIFGVSPAVWLERFNVLPITEWFAFFYYSYFYILSAMILPSLLFDRGRRLNELMVGAMMVAVIGHTGYTLMPGVGPYVTMAFAGPLEGGFFWNQVQKTVFSAGAMMDIFPSLHTAYPSFFALHAFGHRDRAPFKYVWPILAFMACNIIIATMFLRWHYGIDVIFGLMLAFTARQVSIWVSSREWERGEKDDRQPVWERLFRWGKGAA